MRDVEVFLSQILRFFARSLASLRFCFSVSLVMKTSSSLSFLKGEELLKALCDCAPLFY
jgi:hypothetical protein